MVETDYNSDERIKAYLHSRKDDLIESLKTLPCISDEFSCKFIHFRAMHP